MLKSVVNHFKVYIAETRMTPVDLIVLHAKIMNYIWVLLNQICVYMRVCTGIGSILWRTPFKHQGNVGAKQDLLRLYYLNISFLDHTVLTGWRSKPAPA